MKTTKFFLMAALALTFAACSNDVNDILNPAQTAKGEGITITATLAPKDAGATTRKVSEGTNEIVAEWAEYEGIAILYTVGSEKKRTDAKIESVDANGVATISFTVEDGTPDNTECTLIYPKGAAKTDKSGVKDYAEWLGLQWGELSADFDVRVGAGKIKTSTPSLDVTTQPAAQYSIFKFTTQNISGTGITPSEFKVSDSEGNVITTVRPSSSAFYVALPALSVGTYWFSATADSKPYIAKGTVGTATTAGNYYQSTLKMTKGAHLAFLSSDYEAKDGETLTGTLARNVKISIADNATVTLKDANINGSGTWTDAYHAGITCEGDATINLEGTNTVKGFINTYPGIHVPEGKTLIINGPGSLKASTGGTHGSGIGGIHWGSCGNIKITGGTITAEGGAAAAAIGSGNASSCGDITITGGNVTAIGNINNDYRGVGIGCGDGGGEATNRAKCGNITISGGTVTAIGKNGGVGIGSGWSGDCGTITITSGVTSVTATKGSGATNSIGAGDGGTCGTVSIAAGANVTQN